MDFVSGLILHSPMVNSSHNSNTVNLGFEGNKLVTVIIVRLEYMVAFLIYTWKLILGPMQLPEISY